jgi:hypothetical protein
MSPTTTLRFLVFFACTMLGSCQAMYFTTMEKLGVEKREILLDRLEEAHDKLQIAQVRFDGSLSAFREIVGGEEGNLQQNYDRYSDSYDKSEDAAADFYDTVASVQVVAGLMFDEWKRDSGEILDNNLRRASRENYTKATARYERTLRAFRRVEARMDPVLTTFRDHVLYLKLNLHPQALSTLRDNEKDVVDDLQELGQLIKNALKEGAELIEAMSY